MKATCSIKRRRCTFYGATKFWLAVGAPALPKGGVLLRVGELAHARFTNHRNKTRLLYLLLMTTPMDNQKYGNYFMVLRPRSNAEMHSSEQCQRTTTTLSVTRIKPTENALDYHRSRSPKRRLDNQKDASRSHGLSNPAPKQVMEVLTSHKCCGAMTALRQTMDDPAYHYRPCTRTSSLSLPNPHRTRSLRPSPIAESQSSPHLDFAQIATRQ
jgi:hypothetical protein